MECENGADRIDRTDQVRPGCMATEAENSSPISGTAQRETIAGPELDGTGSRISRENLYVVIAPFVLFLTLMVTALIVFELGAQDYLWAYGLLAAAAVVVILLAHHTHMSRRRTD